MSIGLDRIGRFLPGLAVVALFVFLYACASTPDKKNFHVVKRGETLYAISWRYGYDYKKVARWNGIKPPYQIKVGQLIRIRPPTPVVTAQGTKRKPAPVVDNRKPKPQSSPPRKTKSTQAVPAAKPKSQSSASTTKFGWPIKGNVIKGFSGSSRGNQGIDIAGRRGQPVHAAAGGKVVYSGDGLRQLGKLVIIKHDSRLLSAYGYNSELLVKEGDTVRSGQKIAVVGLNKAGQHALHFEIRRDGTPVNPIIYLK